MDGWLGWRLEAMAPIFENVTSENSTLAPIFEKVVRIVQWRLF